MKVPTRSGQELRAVVLAGAAAFAVGGLVAAVTTGARGSPTAAAAVLTYDAGDYRYTYHVITGDESVFDLRADPRELHDLSKSRPALARELRRALEAKMHVDDLETLRDGHADRIRTLKSLGYL
jgi:hypothetical protein